LASSKAWKQARHTAAASAAPRARRRRGRPPKSPDEQALVRRRLLDATRTVFSREGYHGLSVELVLAEAKLSRPTFYKYFDSVDEAIQLVLREANDALIEGVLGAVAGASAPLDKVEAALLAWRRWGEERGRMLRPLFAELHDPHSPVSRYRQRAIQVLADSFLATSEALGRPRPSRLLLDTLIQGIEYLGYRYHLASARDAESWKATRDATLRLAFGLLASEAELAQALHSLRALDIHIVPHEKDR
jgi:AcrR family transcriptional regulator